MDFCIPASPRSLPMGGHRRHVLAGQPPSGPSSELHPGQLATPQEDAYLLLGDAEYQGGLAYGHAGEAKGQRPSRAGWDYLGYRHRHDPGIFPAVNLRGDAPGCLRAGNHHIEFPGAGAVVSATLALHHQAPGLTVPANITSALARFGVDLTAAQDQGHAMTMPEIVAKVPRDRRDAIAGAYVVSMADTHTNARCVCRLIVYGPGFRVDSTAGVPGTFAADFYDAATGSFVRGVSGSL